MVIIYSINLTIAWKLKKTRKNILTFYENERN